MSTIGSGYVVAVTVIPARVGTNIGVLVPLERPAEFGLFDAVVLTIALASQRNLSPTFDVPASTGVFVANRANGLSPATFSTLYGAVLLVVDEVGRKAINRVL